MSYRACQHCEEFSNKNANKIHALAMNSLADKLKRLGEHVSEVQDKKSGICS